jgi:hypothetical protein
MKNASKVTPRIRSGFSWLLAGKAPTASSQGPAGNGNPNPSIRIAAKSTRTSVPDKKLDDVVHILN